MNRCGWLITGLFLLSQVAIKGSVRIEIMDSLVDRNELLAQVGNDTALCAAISRAANTIPEFLDAWKRRNDDCNQFLCDQYLVVVVHRTESGFAPIGVMLERVEDGYIYGRLVRNSLPIHGGDPVKCSFAYVIDWRYRQALEMVGGYVYRELLQRLNARQRRDLENLLPFYIRDTEPNRYRIAVIQRDIETLKEIFTAPRQDVQTLFESPKRSPRKTDRILKVSTNIIEYMIDFGDARCVDLAIEYDRQTPGVLRGGPLRHAIGTGNRKAITRLLEIGVDANERDAIDESMLHWATRRSDDWTVSALIDAGADPNARNRRQQTPLFLADSESIIKLLVAAGGDINATDDEGYTILDRHIENNKHRLAEIVKRYGGKTSGKELRIYPERLSFEETLEVIAREVGEEAANELRDNYYLGSECGAVLPVRALAERREDTSKR